MDKNDMARYMLNSYNEDGAPYHGAIYTDGKIVKVWGAYTSYMLCDNDEDANPTVRPSIQEQILDGTDLMQYRMERPFDGFEIEELDDNAPAKETLDRLNGLTYTDPRLPQPERSDS